MAWRKAYRVLFAVLLTALTVLLCAGAIRIWQEGAARQATDPLAAVYTPEIVEAQLFRVRPLLWAVVAMAAAGPLPGVRGGDSACIRAEKVSPPARVPSPKSTHAVRLVLLAAAVVFILLGALNGSLRDVLLKAINICTECIGLG